MAIDLRELRVGVVSTFPPTRCGVGRFSDALCQAWRVLAPNLDLRVNRIVTGSDAIVPDELVDTVFDPSSPAAVRSVARHLNENEVVLVHHEFGLYGPRDGEAVVDLVQDVKVPVVSVLHTVLSGFSDSQARIVQALSGNGPLVVPTDTARQRLAGLHPAPPLEVRVIEHGTGWTPAPAGRRRRRRIITWGLLGPGKGIERAIEALALIDLEPPPTYDVVGQTHPRIRERYGERYRHSLEELVRDLSLERQVRFIDRFVPDDELRWMVANADVVALPYDDVDQACSGTLIDALALGMPVVATEFPHARELLSDGAGKPVPPDPNDFAAALVHFLEDEKAYRSASNRALQQAAGHSWEGVCTGYTEVLHQARAGVGVS